MASEAGQDSAQSEQASTAEMRGPAARKQTASSDSQPLLDKIVDKAQPLAPVQSALKQDNKPHPAFRAYVGGLSGPKLGFVWIIVGSSVYFGLMPFLQLVGILPKHDPKAAAVMFAQVPPVYYKLSAAVFFSFFWVNLLPIFYEIGPTKMLLAMQLAWIKGISGYADWELSEGRGIVVYDAEGQPMLLHRYFQWLCTATTLVYIITKMAEDNPRRVTKMVAYQTICQVCGLVATLLPHPWKWVFMFFTLTTFFSVQADIWDMLTSARDSCTDNEQRRRLHFLRNITPPIWMTFGVCWHLEYFGLVSIYHAEVVVLWGNFVSKALVSSSLMYSNFMSIHQRRAQAKETAEHANRLRLIEDLQESMRVKEEFLSMVSHELRTPLNGIIGLSEAMLRPGSWNLGDKGTHYVRTIKNSSNHLATLINDILDAASMAKGKLVIKQETVDLKKVVEHVVDTAGHLVKGKVVLEKVVDANTPHIQGDHSRMVQVLYNLVGNSAKFTTEGSITVMLKPMPPSETGEASVQLSVRDSGCGISKAKQRDMFVPFGQGDMTATRKFGGTGLGLSITKKLIEAHHGVISVESTLGVGSTFIVQLPVKHDQEEDDSAAVATRGHSVSFGGDVKREFKTATPKEVEKTLSNAYKIAVTPGLNVTSIPLNSNVTPSPKGTLAPAVSYKLIKLDQTDSADGTPKFMLAGQDNNEPLLPVTEKSLKNRKDDRTQPPTAYGGPFNVLNQPSDSGTTHMSIVDGDMGAFAMTSTVNTYFGSLVVSNSTGIIFNNQMDDFSTPGQVNTYGYTPSPANYIAPGKKPLSTMSPTMVDLDGELRMVLGASGGSRILSTVIQSLLRVLADGLEPFEAVATARLHHQLIPNQVVTENYTAPFPAEHVTISSPQYVIAGLEEYGHNVTLMGSSEAAICQTVVVDPDTGLLTAVSDPRKDGSPAAF